MGKPIYVYEGGGSNPHIIAAIDTDKYSDHDSKAMYAVISKKVNNVSTLEVRIPTNCEASKAITNTSDLVLYDTDGNLQEFHITDIEDIEEYSVLRYIYAEQSIGELINDMVQAGTAMPTTTNPKDYLDYILSFTRWSVGTVDSGIHNSRWEEDLVGRNCLEALQMFIDKYNCEFEVRYETDNKNKITGRYIDVKKTTGHNYGKRFEDDKDILGLKRKIELDSVKTAIYPRIARNVSNEDGSSHTEYIDISEVTWSVAAGDPVDKPKGQAILVNPQADSMYKRYNTKTGKLMDRIMYAEWTEETAKDAEDLISQAWTILQANSVLVPTVELDATDLFRLSGDDPDYWHEQVALGDTCIVISKSFEPELRLETRVMEMEEDLLNPINNSYVFGSYRKTLATSNIEQQKSIEEKLNELQNKLQGVTIPEPKPQYQSGRVYYEDIKGQIQNEFMQSGGYVMAEDADGFWVFDAPVTATYALRSTAANYPTKATILKGGSLAIAEYDTVKAEWVVGTFINGMSINADYINTGHLNADVIEVGSITADHLSLAAIEYIKTGMATEEELQGVIADISAIQSDYVTSQALQQAIDGVTGGTLTLSQVKAIEDTQRQLKAEYNSVYKQASLIYANEYLPAGSTEKVALGEKITAYTSAYNTYNNQITSMIADQNITDDEYNTYKANASAYDTALTNLFEAIENANNARLTNVYAQARQGLVTTAQLEVNNKSVIASAKQGMVSTSDMTEAISFATKDLVSTGELQNAINDATSGLTTTEELGTEVAKAKIPAFQEAFKAITTEYKGNLKQIDTLLSNSYLTGTAKTNLTKAKSDYTNKYNALKTAVDAIVNDVSVDETHLTNYNTALTNLQTSATTAAQRMQEALKAINDAVYNESKGYADGLKNSIDSEISDVNTALTGLRNTMNGSFKDSVVSEAEALAIKYYMTNLNSEKADIDKEYDTVVTNSSITSSAQSTLSTAKNNYNTAHYNLINTITDAISDNLVSDTERDNIDNYCGLYNTALTNYREALQQAIDSITTNKIDNATADLVSADAMSTAINSAVDGLASLTDVSSAKNNAVLVSKIEAIKQTYSAIKAEYNNNLQQATTLYANSYLASTAKTNLNNAKSDYTTKFNAVTTAYNNIASDNTLSESELAAWNTAVTNLQSSTTTLAERIQEAQTYINTAIYNASKKYTDTAIPDALTGYAKTKYVDDAKAAAIADAKKGMVSTSQLEVNNTEILMKTASMGQYNLLRNTDYRAGTEHWNSWGTGNGIKIKISTSSDYINCMSGERNLGVTTDSSITSLDHSVGFKQFVELTNNVTYTLSYWVNCVKCRCTVNIETNDTIGGESTGILATKNYTNINGNQKRETWKYDSISFTVPKLATNYDKKVISVVFYIDTVSAKQARAWLVKPMLGTGINAQAWTAHPDEIHVGVVSVTEEEGIKVEHSDSNTYTTLNAAGLQIRSTNDDSLVASFGENNSAYIGKLTCDGYVKAPQLMPVANYKDVVHMYYCSERGSGDFSGKSTSNQAIGWGGVMRAILSDLDIDYTHEKGGFIIPANFTTPITIYIKGTEFSSDIVLGNIFGGGNSALQIRIDAGCKFTGRIVLSDIDIPVQIFGNNSTMYRGSSKLAPISLDNVKYCYVYKLKVNYSSQQIATVAVQMYDSNCIMTDVDMCNCYSAAALNRSHLFMNDCSGNLHDYVNGGQLGYLNLYSKVPAHTSSDPYGSYCINTTPSNRTLKPTGTTQSGGSSVTMPVTKTYNITTYSSVLQYYRYGCLIQGTPNGSSSSYVGNMTVSGVNKVLATMNNDVVIQVFLEREGVTTVDTDYVDVVIDGTKAGTLRSTASGWFNLPSSTVNSLKENETVTIKLNATGKNNYTQYKLNAMLKITGTQTV